MAAGVMEKLEGIKESQKSFETVVCDKFTENDRQHRTMEGELKEQDDRIGTLEREHASRGSEFNGTCRNVENLEERIEKVDESRKQDRKDMEALIAGQGTTFETKMKEQLDGQRAFLMEVVGTAIALTAVITGVLVYFIK